MVLELIDMDHGGDRLVMMIKWDGGRGSKETVTQCHTFPQAQQTNVPVTQIRRTML